MQSPSAEASDSERRARLLELEERQRRLQQLCEEALREDEQHQRVIEHLEIRTGSFAGPPPPPGFPFSQSPERALSYSLTAQRGENGLAPPQLSSYASRRGGGNEATATYQDDLLTGEVQSFRDPNSVARGSSVNTIRDPSLPQPPPPPASAGARSVLPLHDTRGRYQAPASHRGTPTLSPQDDNSNGNTQVRDRLHVGSGDRGYRRFPSNGMVDTPVYRGSNGSSTNNPSVNWGYRGGSAELFGPTEKRTPPPPPPPPPPPSATFAAAAGGPTTFYRQRTAPTTYSRAAPPPPPPPPAAAAAARPPPPPFDGWDEVADERRPTAAAPCANAKVPFLAPPASSSAAATARAMPNTVSGRRRALRERYGLGHSGATKRLHSPTGGPTPPPPQAGMVGSPPPAAPLPPPAALTTAGLFDSDSSSSEGGAGSSWRDRLRQNDQQIRASDRVARRQLNERRQRQQRRQPPPPPQDDANNKYARFHRGDGGRIYAPAKNDDDEDDPWERHSLTPSMMSAEERRLGTFFNSPWQNDRRASDRWRRERDALNAATTGRAPLPPPPPRARHHRRRQPPPPPPDMEADPVEEELYTSMDYSASEYTAPTPHDEIAAPTERRRTLSYPNMSSHPYGGGGSGEGSVAKRSTDSLRHQRPTAQPLKPPLGRLNANRRATAKGPLYRSNGSGRDTKTGAISPATNTLHGSHRGGEGEDGDASFHISGVRGIHARAQAARRPGDEEDALSCFDEDPGKAALREMLHRAPLAPQPAEAQMQRPSQGPRGRSPSLRSSGGVDIHISSSSSYAVPQQQQQPQQASYSTAAPPAPQHSSAADESASQLPGRSRRGGSGTPVPPLPTTVAQAEIQEAKAKAEALARHLVKAMKDKKLLQENVEQLEELVEECNFEVGRLQRTVEEQNGESAEALGLQAALRAKEREIAVCEDEIKRLNNIVDAHVLHLAAAGNDEDDDDDEASGRRDLVARTAEMEAAMAEIGIAHVAQREAEDRAEQLGAELEAAVEQIRALDERLAEMERAAAAERLREVRSGLRSGSSVAGSQRGGGGSMSQPQRAVPPPGSLAIPIPSAQETESWPLSARRALARVVSQAEGLLVQNSESSRHATARMQHLEHSCGELQRRLSEKKSELNHLQDECIGLQRDKNAMRMVGDQWFRQLQEVKADAQLVSELVRTSREDAENVVVASKTADVHLDSMAQASRSPFAPASPPSPASLAALHEKNEHAKDFAQQVMRDMHAIARFLSALREMDIGEQSGYKILQSLASGGKPADKLYLVTDDGTHSPKTVKAIATGGDAIARRVREKRDLVIQAVEHALSGGGERDLVTAATGPTRRLDLRRGSEARSEPRRSSGGGGGNDNDLPPRWDAYSRTDGWDGEYPQDTHEEDGAVSEVAQPDGFEADLEHPDAEEVDVHDSPHLTTQGNYRQSSVNPASSRHPNTTGLVASDFRGSRAAVAAPPMSLPAASVDAALEPLPPHHQQQHPPPPQREEPRRRSSKDEVAPVARPLRLSSTPPERPANVVDADIDAGATDAAKARRLPGKEEQNDYTLVSSPSMSPPTHDRSGIDEKAEKAGDGDMRAEQDVPTRSDNSSERRRLQLSSPSHDRDDGEARKPEPPSLPHRPPSATLLVSPDTEQRAPRAGTAALSPGEEDDDSPHLARPAEVTKAFDSQRQSGDSDELVATNAGEEPAKRSSSPPVTVAALQTEAAAPVSRADSPLKSKSASVDAPPPTAPSVLPEGAPPRPSTSSLPKERSTTAPPSSDHNRHKRNLERDHEHQQHSASATAADGTERKNAARRRAVHNSSSDSDYDEATLGFMGGPGSRGGRGGGGPDNGAMARPNVVQEVRVAEPNTKEAVGLAKPRSVYNRIAALDSREDSHCENSTTMVPSDLPPPPAPTQAEAAASNSGSSSSSEFAEEVTELEEREAPPPPLSQQGDGMLSAATSATAAPAPHTGRRRLPGENDSTATLDNLDSISSINDSVHNDKRRHEGSSQMMHSSSSGYPRRPPTPVGDASANAPAPLPPRLQRSALPVNNEGSGGGSNRLPSAPTSGHTSGRETPLERPASITHLPPQQRRPSPNPAAPAAGVEPTMPPSVPQPQQRASLPRPGGPSSRGPTPVNASLAPSVVTPPEQRLGAGSNPTADEPPEVPLTAIPSSRRNRPIQSPDRYDSEDDAGKRGGSRESDKDSRSSGHQADEHSTAFTGLGGGDMSRTLNSSAGGVGLPSAPASSADAILRTEPAKIPQPAAPLPSEPLSQSQKAGGDSANRLPLRAGSRQQQQRASPEVATLPRVNADDVGHPGPASVAAAKEATTSWEVPPQTTTTPHLMHLTTRGRSGSASSSSKDLSSNLSDSTPHPLPVAAIKPATAQEEESSNLAADTTASPPSPQAEEEPTPTNQSPVRGPRTFSRASSSASTPRSSVSSSHLYDPEARQKRKEDVARILQRLKDVKNRGSDGAASSSTSVSATPSPGPG